MLLPNIRMIAAPSSSVIVSAGAQMRIGIGQIDAFPRITPIIGAPAPGPCEAARFSTGSLQTRVRADQLIRLGPGYRYPPIVARFLDSARDCRWASFAPSVRHFNRSTKAPQPEI